MSQDIASYKYVTNIMKREAYSIMCKLFYNVIFKKKKFLYSL